MLLLDSNVLLAAQRGDHPDHGLVRPWFDELLISNDAFSVADIVWTSFLRITTNRRIFPVPTPLLEAFEFLDATCAQAQYLALTGGPRHLELVRKMCLEANASGDLVPDAVIAAIALEHNCTIVTLDRDFARFPSVRHFAPGQPSKGAGRKR